MISSARTPSLKFMPFFVEEFHRARKPAPLHRFLVYGQLSDDKQRPYTKSQVYAVLRRRVPPCAETSSAAPFSHLRHNPKKKLFTRAEDIEAALNAIKEDMEFCITENNLKIDTINWENVPDGANPSAGHLPDERMTRKTQQLENLTLAVLNIAKDGDLIVDFCSGSGHLEYLNRIFPVAPRHIDADAVAGETLLRVEIEDEKKSGAFKRYYFVTIMLTRHICLIKIRKKC
ncbi:Glutathione S-transferase C-terminal domain-containing protein homolog [Eumeta japonica]|uniref:Glutathione S-transferase C-terminal domain-containing protein homolog n=1 Tax=Eumeta variegata TaxID=151549 RepID=A0A4C1UPQ3_EUMVA|nr:Glutathione S-transferase C-terminal domain-containing protein homolog [Eumeta japonica]